MLLIDLKWAVSASKLHSDDMERSNWKHCLLLLTIKKFVLFCIIDLDISSLFVKGSADKRSRRFGSFQVSHSNIYIFHSRKKTGKVEFEELQYRGNDSGSFLWCLRWLLNTSVKIIACASSTQLFKPSCVHTKCVLQCWNYLDKDVILIKALVHSLIITEPFSGWLGRKHCLAFYAVHLSLDRAFTAIYSMNRSISSLLFHLSKDFK